MKISLADPVEELGRDFEHSMKLNIAEWKSGSTLLLCQTKGLYELCSLPLP